MATLTVDMPSYKTVPTVTVPPAGFVPGYSHYDEYGDNLLIRPEFADEVQALENVDRLTERGPGDPNRNVSLTTLIEVKRNALLLMQSKVLHEFVHWARVRVSKLPPGPKVGPGEVGWKFERDAYGKDQTARSLGLSRFVTNW